MDNNEWTPYDIRRGFVEGAKWWMWYLNGDTLNELEVHLAEDEANKRYADVVTVEVDKYPETRYRFEWMDTLPPAVTDILCIFADRTLYRLQKGNDGVWRDEDGVKINMDMARMWCPAPDVARILPFQEEDGEYE